MEGELTFISTGRSSFSDEDGGSGFPTWASTLEALLNSPSSCASDGRGGAFSSPKRASPHEKLLSSAPSFASDCRSVGNAGGFSYLTGASPLELKSPSSCVSDGRGGAFSSPTRTSALDKLLISPPSSVSDCRGVCNAGGFSSLGWASPLEKPLRSPSSCGYSLPLAAWAEQEREVHEAESKLRSISERYDGCFLRLRDAMAELADLRRERLRLGAENLHLSLLLEELESEQRKHASAVAPPTSVEEEAAQGSAPKSISIRSTSFLSQKKPQGEAKPQRLRVRASQAMEEAGKEEEDVGEVEVEAYRQGTEKTELCNKWDRGACPYGVRCRFAHGLQEMRPVIRHPRYKTLPCQMFVAGSGCPYGHRCHFRHSPLPTESY